MWVETQDWLQITGTALPCLFFFSLCLVMMLPDDKRLMKCFSDPNAGSVDVQYAGGDVAARSSELLC